MEKHIQFFFTLISLTFTNLIIADTYKIAFGSCLDQDYPQPIWEAIKNENIDSFIFLGDNVYGDIPSGKLNKMEIAYTKQKQMIPEWLFNKDVHAIWDDHDYGINDGGGSYPLKVEAQKMYVNFWNIPADDIRRTRQGVYTNKIVDIDGFKINIILLDTRYFRSNLDRTIGLTPVYKKNLDPEATILGKDQWMWFEDALELKSDLTIIATSIQVLPTSHRFEKWSNFPSDHIKLKNLLKKSAAPVLIISGDRHQGAIYQEENIFEITSSSLNKTISASKFIGRPKEEDVLMQGDMYSGENFGLITIDSDEKKYLIELKDLNGNQVRYKLIDIEKGV